MNLPDLNIAPALERGLTILEMAAGSPSPLGFNEISQVLGLSRSSTIRLVKVLCQRQYLVKDPVSGKYSLGPRMAGSGRHTSPLEALLKNGGPCLKPLSDKTGNTCILVYWTGSHLQCLAREIQEASIPMQPPGNIAQCLDTFPWGCFIYQGLTAAAQKEKQILFYDPKNFKRNSKVWLSGFSQQGYFYDNQLMRANIRRLAAIIYNHEGGVLGALAMGGNPLTIPDTKVEKYGLLVKEAADKISAAMGYLQ